MRIQTLVAVLTSLPILAAADETRPSAEGVAAPTVQEAPAPTKLSDFKPGETTAAQVMAVLGKPRYVDRDPANPTGQFVHLYQISPTVRAAFLYGRDQVLIRVRAYEDQPGK
jgi:hypothetical protein